MKNICKTALISILLLMATATGIAQNPPHPNGGNQPGSGNTTVGGQQGGAPIGNGTFILLTFAMAYASRKMNGLRVMKEE